MKMKITDLRPSELGAQRAVPGLVEKYRKSYPVDPIVVNAKGTILDGHHRAASALAAGRTEIFAVRVLGNKETGTVIPWELVAKARRSVRVASEKELERARNRVRRGADIDDVAAELALVLVLANDAIQGGDHDDRPLGL